jgi:hypothetical protein
MSDKHVETENLYMDLAIEMVLAMMSSADLDTIGAMNWWPRARAALAAGVAAGSTMAGMVSVMGDKLQIQVLSNRSAERIRAVELKIQDFEQFQSLVDAQGLYIVARAQLAAAETRAARQDPKNGQLDLAPEVTG